MMYFTSSSLSSGRTGVPYEGRINVAGNLGAQRFSIQEGELPPGLEIVRDTGWIHGTPEADGGYYGFTVAVADPQGGTICRDFEIRILAATGVKSVSRNPLPGFNGERLDPVTGMTHLGNGYRAYNPVLMRFNCPDSLSPFGAGGINPYAYCAGDPVNRADPSGHLNWQAITGIALGIIGLGAAIFTAGTSIAAAGGIIAAMEATSAAGLAVGGLGVVGDVTAIASGATEDLNPAVSALLGVVSLVGGVGGLGIAGRRLAKNLVYDGSLLYETVAKDMLNIKRPLTDGHPLLEMKQAFDINETAGSIRFSYFDDTRYLEILTHGIPFLGNVKLMGKGCEFPMN